MPRFEYEAQNEKGKRIKGVVDVEREEDLVKMLSEMGFMPESITPVRPGPLKYYYVGKDHSGKVVEGSIEANDHVDIAQKLEQMGVKQFRISTQSNLDVPYDDTIADKAAKGVAGLMIGVIFLAAMVVAFTFPTYWEAVNLDGENARVTNGTIVERKEDSRLVKYTFEVAGKHYQRDGYLSTKDKDKFQEGDSIAIRYSVKRPSINHLASRKLPNVESNRKLLFIAGAILLAAMLILFYCSCFHYIGRILKARAANQPIPHNDVLRLLVNTISTLLFALIFLTMGAVFQAQNHASLYYPYTLYLIGLMIVFAVIAIILNKKKPVFYD